METAEEEEDEGVLVRLLLLLLEVLLNKLLVSELEREVLLWLMLLLPAGTNMGNGYLCEECCGITKVGGNPGHPDAV